MQQQFMANLIAQLQTTMPNFQFDTPFPEYFNLNQPLNPNPNLNPKGNDNVEDEDENLGDD